MEERVKEALELVRPTLQADGGDVELVSISDDGTVSIRLVGACDCCPMAQLTIKGYIEQYLKKEVPGVVEVVAA